jgi:hypothetical protein
MLSRYYLNDRILTWDEPLGPSKTWAPSPPMR